MEFPEDLLYSKSHEWVRREGTQVTIGLTDYAQSQLKDIVFVDLPEAGREFRREENIGVVESVKTVADIFSPVSGKVLEKNDTLKEHPEFINVDPYGKGWLVKMELTEEEELKGLLSPGDYRSTFSEEP